MTPLAWGGALLIGLSLGLLGSGGSILTVLVLVYLAGVEEKLAVAQSLAIVGGISLFGVVPYIRRRQVDWRSAALFGLPGMLGTYAGAALSSFLSGAVQLLLFASVMILAAVMMSRPKPAEPAGQPRQHSPFNIGAEGLGVGLVTGLVGVGGGFLIIPALVLLLGLPMSLAVGTSLLIIAANSFAGFYKYAHLLGLGQMDWTLIASFIAIGAAGSWLGSAAGRKVSNEALRKGFAAFLVLAGLYVLGTNLPKVL